MEVEYADEDLCKLATDAAFTMGLDCHAAKKYRNRIAYLISAKDERDLYALQGSLDYKKLKGGGNDERQMRLNNKLRIRLKVVEKENGKVLLITGVGDFHD